MRHFIGRIILFFVVLITLSFTLFYCINKVLLKKSSLFELKIPVKSLFLGHSHTARAYNDTIIPEALNMAQPGDSYFYIYLKAQFLIEHNPEIETVFIEYTNNLLDSKMDEWIWGDVHLNYKFRKLCAVADLEDYLMLLKCNPKGFVANYSIGLRKNSELILFNDSNIYKVKDWGGFEVRVDTLGYDAEIKHKLRVNNEVDYMISETSVHYLKQTLDYLKAKNKKVVLIRTPVHDNHSYLRNEVYFKKLLDSLSYERFIDLKLLDLADRCFADYGHLNYMGSEVVTKALIKTIN